MVYGLKDKIGNSSIIINSSKIENEFLINNFITEFNENYEVERNIRSDKIDISKITGSYLIQLFLQEMGILKILLIKNYFLKLILIMRKFKAYFQTYPLSLIEL